MTESECIKEIVNQVAVQEAMGVVVAFRDTETGPQLATTPNQWENQRQRNGRLVLKKPRFSWDVPDRYVQLINFQLGSDEFIRNQSI